MKKFLIFLLVLMMAIPSGVTFALEGETPENLMLKSGVKVQQMTDGDMAKIFADDGDYASVGSLISNSRDTKNTWFAIDLGTEYTVSSMVIDQLKDRIKDYRVFATSNSTIYSEITAFPVNRGLSEKGKVHINKSNGVETDRVEYTEDGIIDKLIAENALVASGTLESPNGYNADTAGKQTITFNSTKDARYIIFVVDTTYREDYGLLMDSVEVMGTAKAVTEPDQPDNGDDDEPNTPVLPTDLVNFAKADTTTAISMNFGNANYTNIFTDDSSSTGYMSVGCIENNTWRTSNSWLVLDLGAAYKLSALVIDQWKDRIKNYEVYATTNTSIYNEINGMSDKRMALGGAGESFTDKLTNTTTNFDSGVLDTLKDENTLVASGTFEGANTETNTKNTIAFSEETTARYIILVLRDSYSRSSGFLIDYVEVLGSAASNPQPGPEEPDGPIGDVEPGIHINVVDGEIVVNGSFEGGTAVGKTYNVVAEIYDEKGTLLKTETSADKTVAEGTNKFSLEADIISNVQKTKAYITADESETIVAPVEETTYSLKVLGIGNSFTNDSMEHLYGIAKDLGIDNVVLGKAIIGGTSLENHATNAANGSASYTYGKNTNGTWVDTASQNLMSCIRDEDWNLIVIQQVSQYSGMTETFEPHLTNLINYINTNKKNPYAKIAWNMTWAYAQDSAHAGFQNYDSSQEKMYKAITDAGKHIENNYSNTIDFILPPGTAIQNARTSYIGDNLDRDGYHLDLNIGRYLAGLTWVHKITGLSIDAVDYVPAGEAASFPSKYFEVAIASAKNAVTTPYAVTSFDTGESDNPDTSDTPSTEGGFEDSKGNKYQKSATNLMQGVMKGTALETLTDGYISTGIDVVAGDSYVIDMGKEKVMNTISIIQNGSRIKDYKIYYSCDNENWNLFKEGTLPAESFNFNVIQPTEHSFKAESAIARFVKIEITSLYEDASETPVVPQLMSVEAYNTENGTTVNALNIDTRSDITSMTSSNSISLTAALSPSADVTVQLPSKISSSHNMANTMFAIDLGAVTTIDSLQIVQQHERIGKYRVFVCETTAAWEDIKAIGGKFKPVTDEMAANMRQIATGTFAMSASSNVNTTHTDRNLVHVVNFGQEVRCRYLVFVADTLAIDNYGVPTWAIEAYDVKTTDAIYTPDGTEPVYNASAMGENYADGKKVYSAGEYVSAGVAYTTASVLTDGVKNDGKNIFYLGGKTGDVVIDFGEQVPVDRAVIYQYGERMEEYSLYWSADNETWNLLGDYTSTANTNRVPNYKETEFDFVIARYLKLVPKKASGIIMLAEIEAYCSMQSATLVNLITEETITDEALTAVASDLFTLPTTITEGANSAAITWSVISGDTGVVNPATGAVVRGNEDKAVVLRAHFVTNTGDEFDKDFKLVVVADKSGVLAAAKAVAASEYAVTGTGEVAGGKLQLSQNSSASYTYSETNGFMLKDNFAVEFELINNGADVTLNLGSKTVKITKDGDDTVISLDTEVIMRKELPASLKYKIEVIDNSLNVYVDRGQGYRLFAYNKEIKNAVFTGIDAATQAGESLTLGGLNVSVPEKFVLDNVLNQFDFGKISEDSVLDLKSNLTLIENALGVSLSYTSNSDTINAENGAVNAEKSGVVTFTVTASYNGTTKDLVFKPVIGNLISKAPVSATESAIAPSSTQSITEDVRGKYFLTRAESYDIVIELPEEKALTHLFVNEAPTALGSITAYELYGAGEDEVYKKIASGNSVGEELTLTFIPVKVKYIKFSVKSREGDRSGVEKIFAIYNPTDLQRAQTDIISVELPETVSGTFTLTASGAYGSTLSYSTEYDNISITPVDGGYSVTVTQPDYDTTADITITANCNGQTASKVVRVKVTGKNQVGTELPDNFGSGGSSSGGSGGSGGGSVAFGGSAATPDSSEVVVVPSIPKEENTIEKELENHWAKEEIKALIGKGIVKGDGKSLNLDSSVTRAEYIAMIVRAMGWTASGNNSQFKDVKATDWFAEVLQTGYENGLFKGDGINAMPNKSITRQEAAVMLANICKDVENEAKGFTDGANISDWAQDGVDKAAALGLITGYEDGSFAPVKNIRRDEAMVVIYRLLNLE